MAQHLNLQDEHGEVSVGEVRYEVLVRLHYRLLAVMSPQSAESLPGPGVGGLQQETPEGEDVTDGEGGVGSLRQAGGEIATLGLVKAGLPAFV